MGIFLHITLVQARVFGYRSTSGGAKLRVFTLPLCVTQRVPVCPSTSGVGEFLLLHFYAIFCRFICLFLLSTVLVVNSLVCVFSHLIVITCLDLILNFFFYHASHCFLSFDKVPFSSFFLQWLESYMFSFCSSVTHFNLCFYINIYSVDHYPYEAFSYGG